MPNHRLTQTLLLTTLLVACHGQEELPPATGTLEVAEVDVAPVVTGRVEKVLVEEGATVHKEDLLAILVQPSTSMVANASDLALRAPVSGVVLSRNVEPGEVVTPSQPAITIGDVTRPWVRVYVNQRNLPRVRLGGLVTATLDGMPERKFTGIVKSINTQAEYTPRVALTEEERADLMFGVKIEFSDNTGTLKPGLPVTVNFQAK